MAFEEILGYMLWGNTVQDYLTAAVVFTAFLISLKIFKYEVVQRLKKLAKKTSFDIDDFIIRLIDNLGWPFYSFISFYLASRFIVLPGILDQIMYYILLLVSSYYLIKSMMSVIDYGTGKVVKRRQAEEKEADTTIIDLFRKILKMLVLIGVFLFAMSSLGYDITGAITGLGVGGIVIGFALQGILSDVFASFSIYFDKPFRKGDFIIIGQDDMGVVKKIGIKSTRIQHLHGEELVVSNKELTTTRVHNYKKMEKRRVVFTFGVTYDTPTAKLKKIPGVVEKIFSRIKEAELSRVHFKSYGDFSLNFEVAYYVNLSDYNKYMDIQQEINLSLKEEMEKMKVEFAYPTQTVFVHKQK